MVPAGQRLHLGFSGMEVATLSVRPCSNEPSASLHYAFNLLELRTRIRSIPDKRGPDLRTRLTIPRRLVVRTAGRKGGDQALWLGRGRFRRCPCRTDRGGSHVRPEDADG
jgi:hypothetical protein